MSARPLRRGCDESWSCRERRDVDAPAGSFAAGRIRPTVRVHRGAVVSLYLDRVRPADVRATRDVDVVVAATSYASWHHAEAWLRDRGWTQPLLEDAPICRWRTPDGVLVDMMPAHSDVLGFSNPWYEPGIARATHKYLDDGTSIALFGAADFVATKIAAFEGRGRGDWYASHDLEDIFTIIEGRTALIGEVADAPADVRVHIETWAARLLALTWADDVIEAHVSREVLRSGFAAIVRQRVWTLARGGG